MKVLEQENCGFHVVEHGVQRSEWVRCAAGAPFRALRLRAVLDESLRQSPHEQLFLSPLGDFLQVLLGPLFFPAHKVNDGIAGSNQYLQLFSRRAAGRDRRFRSSFALDRRRLRWRRITAGRWRTIGRRWRRRWHWVRGREGALRHGCLVAAERRSSRAIRAVGVLRGKTSKESRRLRETAQRRRFVRQDES